MAETKNPAPKRKRIKEQLQEAQNAKPRGRILFQILLIFMISSATSVIIGISYVKNKTQAQAQTDQIKLEQAELKQKKARTHKENLEKQARLKIQKFTNDLKTRMDQYQRQRKLLAQIIDAHNYETPEYARETYDNFRDNLAPSLRQNGEAVINFFATNDKILDPILLTDPSFKEYKIYKEWKAQHTELLNRYVEFFLKEEEILQNYDALITFYYRYNGYYSVNAETNSFIFNSAQAEEMAAKLRAPIDALKSN